MKDDEISGSGNMYTAEYWEYDSRLIWRWNPDQVVKPWESPYACFSNNPIIMIDPNGNDDDNYTIFSDGTMSKEETEDNTNTYTYIDENENTIDLGTYNKVENSNGEDMVEAGSGATGSNDMYTWNDITSGNLYFEEDAFAGLLGGMQKFYDNAEQDVDKVQINQFMSLDRKHGDNRTRHSALDVAYYHNDGTVGALTTDNDISNDLNILLLNSFKDFGLGSTAVYSSKSETSMLEYFTGTSGWKGHHHHFHFEGFSKDITTQLPTLNVTAFKPLNWYNLIYGQ